MVEGLCSTIARYCRRWGGRFEEGKYGRNITICRCTVDAKGASIRRVVRQLISSKIPDLLGEAVAGWSWEMPRLVFENVGVEGKKGVLEIYLTPGYEHPNLDISVTVYLNVLPTRNAPVTYRCKRTKLYLSKSRFPESESMLVCRQYRDRLYLYYRSFEKVEPYLVPASNPGKEVRDLLEGTVEDVEYDLKNIVKERIWNILERRINPFW